MGLFSGIGNYVSNMTLRVNWDGKPAESGLMKLKGQVATLIGALALKQVYDYTRGLAQMGAEAVSVEKNFKRFADARNRDVGEMMHALRKATMGTISDVQLQQRAMQAMVGGVKFDDMITAMEYVTKFASATGQDVNTKMQSTMTGLARKSAQFLDDIGIQVMGSKDVIKDAVEQMKQKMGQFTASEDDAALGAQRLTASWDNTKQQIGRDLMPALVGLNTFLLGMGKTVGWLAKTWSNEWEIIGAATVKGVSNAVTDKRTQNAIAQAKANKDDLLLIGERKKILDEISKVEKEIAKFQKYNIPEWGYKSHLNRLSDLKMNAADLKKAIFDIVNEAPKKSVELPGITPADPDSAKKRQDAARKMDQLGQQMYEDATERAYEEAEAIWNIKQKEEDEKIRIIHAAEQIQSEIKSRYFEGRKELLDNEFRNNFDILSKAGASTVELERDYQRQIYEIDKEAAEQKKQLEEEVTRKHEEEIEKRVELGQQYVSTASQLAGALSQLSDARYQRELRNLEDSHNKRKMSDRQYNKEKDRIEQENLEKRRQFARAEQLIVVARAISDAAGMVIGIGKDTPGGVVTRIAGMALGAIAAGIQVATIQAQNFETGGLHGDLSRGRGRDDYYMVGNGEYIMPAPQTAANYEALEAIRTNTANTAAGMARMRGGGTTVIIQGAPVEHVTHALATIERRGLSRREI